jgi:hypothetical protein
MEFRSSLSFAVLPAGWTNGLKSANLETFTDLLNTDYWILPSILRLIDIKGRCNLYWLEMSLRTQR